MPRQKRTGIEPRGEIFLLTFLYMRLYRFSATIPAARKLHEIGDKPCPARECAIADAGENAKRILEKIDER